MQCCCNVWDPSLGHSANDQASLELRDVAKRLKSDDQLSAAGTILSIFSPSSGAGFCAVSLGLKRCCITVLNWIPAVGGVEVRAVGIGLALHLARIEPRLAAVLVTESLEVLRLLRDSLLLSGEQQIEIFPRFVAASKRALTGGAEDQSRRGLLLALAGPGQVVVAIHTLCALVSAVTKRLPGILSGSGVVQKLGMAVLSLASEPVLRQSAVALFGIARSLPVHEIDGNVEIFLQLAAEFGDDPEAQWLFSLLDTEAIDSPVEAIGTPKSDEGEETQLPSSLQAEATFIRIPPIESICRSVEQSVSLGMSGRALSVESALARLVRAEAGFLPALQNSVTALQDSVGTSGTVDSVTVLANILVGGFGDRLFSTIAGNRDVVGRAVTLLCARHDLPGLWGLGKKLGFGSPAELVVTYLEGPVLVNVLEQLVLQHCVNRAPSGAMSQFLAVSVFENKYSISQLVDSNGPETVVAALVLVSAFRGATRSEQAAVVKRVMGAVSNVSSASPGARTKRLKPNSSSPENVAASFMTDNFLHILQLLEGRPKGEAAAALSLLVDSAGGGAVRTFSVRICEAGLRLNCDEGFWKSFAAAIHSDESVLLPILPVVYRALVECKCEEFAGQVLELKGVSVGLKALLTQKGSVQEAVSGLESELRLDRTVSVKLALLRAASLLAPPTTVLTTKSLLTDILELVSRNVAVDEVVSVCADFLSVFGPFVVPPVVIETEPVMGPGGGQDFSATDFAVSLINQFLLPNVKQGSHAFAIQELLAALGGSSFVAANFPEETKQLLTPYLASTYRASGSLDFNIKLKTLQDVFLWLCSVLPVRKELFLPLRVAVAKDPALCAWLLPFAVEVLASNLPDDDSADAVAAQLVAAFASLIRAGGELNTNINTTAVFGIIDRLRARTRTVNKRSSRESKFISAVSESDNDEILVQAALAVHDYPRALWYQERLLLGSRTSTGDVVQLGKIFSALGDTAGVIGACTLVGADVCDPDIAAMRLETTGRAYELLVQAEATGGSPADLVRLLVENGHYKSAIAVAAGQTTDGLKDKLEEASWKLGDWSALVPSDTESFGFNEAFCSVASGRKDSSGTSRAKKILTEKMALNLNLEDLAKLFCLNQIESSSLTAESVRGIPGECRGIILECQSALSSGEKRNAWLIELLRHYRKSGSVSKVKQLLPILSGRPEAVVECAKSWWLVGERGIAYRSLEACASLPSAGELLRLKYAAELEAMIPKLVIARYRELLCKAVNESGRRGAALGFAEYLDSVGVVFSESSTWNRQELVREIASNFFDSVRFDTNGKRVMYALNRLFQLHWELSHSGDSAQMKLSSEIVRVFQNGWKLVPVRIWYSALPQLLTRLGAADFGPICQDIIVAVLAEYPRQACWGIVPGLLNSRSPDRRAAGVKILQQAMDKSDYPNMAQLVSVIRLVGESLVAVARADNIKSLSESKEGSRLLRSTGGLLVVPTQAQICSIPDSEVRVAKFNDAVHTYNTKAKPKRLGLVDSNGRSVQFILKLEKKTDLRKDSRMMDFVNVVNSEVAKRQRNAATHQVAALRTYSVLTLSEDTALIEFVPNLVTVRKIIDEALQRIGKSVSLYLNKEVMAKLSHKTEGFTYFTSVVETVPPMIAEWLAREFGASPKTWLAARSVFTKSQAGWSVVGHIVGLGDRHPDNILIDAQSGEVVHVDFDCIFSRGMVLTIPELVPFRLTKICVSAMGVCGVEGPFRACCEEMMRLVRDKKKMLLAVLHAFIADPLIDWQGTGAKKAKDVIGAVEKKLCGYVDVGEMRITPDMDEKLIVFNEGAEKNTGLGKDRGAALSVEGQVDELIRAAVCQRNLAKMYLGWMPLF